jgi:DUF4097 and DUF4098 domain-containing protein YvlB
MESKNRNLWIILAVIAVLLCLCAIVVAALVAAGAGFFTAFPAIREGGIGRVTESTEQVYSVGQAPQLEIDNFAGNVTVRSGESGRIRVIVEKKAMSDAGLQRISVGLEEQDNGLRIRTSRPSNLNASESVDIEVYVPADARLVLDTGAGNVQIDGVQGEIQAHSGAGNVEVWNAAGPVNLDTGAGNVEYEGEPRGEGTFETGAGNINLRLPADANVLIDLQTGLGNIDLGGFAVRGDTSGTDIQGTIGTGEQATIRAQTGAGNIELNQR